MKRITVLLMCLWLSCSCMAAIIGGSIAGGWWAGKYYHNKADAYTAYVDNCKARGDYPLSYDTWSRTEWRKEK